MCNYKGEKASLGNVMVMKTQEETENEQICKVSDGTNTKHL